MDGDLRPRYRRFLAPQTADNSWGYSATLAADIGHPLTAPARRTRAWAPDEMDEKRSKPGAANQPEARDDEQQAAKPAMPPGRKRLYIGLAVAAAAILIACGVLYWLYARQFESTDDAFIDGYMSQVSAQVAAKVVKLEVTDNQVVKAGQTLLRLDPRDFQVGLDQARAQRAQAAAQVEQARAQLLLLQANLDQAQAQVRVSQADLGQQQLDLARYRKIDPKAVTKQQVDASNAQTKSAAARVDAAKQAVEGVRAQIKAQQAQIEAAVANLKAADVAIENAQLQLSYATVTAPQDGKVTNRSVDVGNYVKAGQALLAVVPPDLWVTANFKETQLAGMKAGQAVAISVDACPGADISGHVESFQSGTGSVFSSLPAENATGNYVKVVQRVPVKIVFDHKADDCRLAPGLSVVPSVTVK